MTHTAQTHTPEAPPTISWQTKLEAVATDAAHAKAEIKTKLRDLVNQSDEVNQERLRLEAAIADAERRLSINSSSRGTYVNERADLVARAMLGETVDIESAKPTSTLDGLNAEDLKAGLATLKIKYDECRYRWRTLRGQVNTAQKEFSAQHAVEHMAKYLTARQQLVDSWVEIRGAQEVFNENSELKIPVFTSLNFDDICLPGVGIEHELAKPLKAARSDASGSYKGESLRHTGVTMAAIDRIKGEFSDLKGA
jgi:hypothetical protein